MLASVAVGVILMAAALAALIWLPAPWSAVRALASWGAGVRRWWVMGLAVALTLLVGIAESGSPDHDLVLFLVAVTVVPLLLACLWAWARARSLS